MAQRKFSSGRVEVINCRSCGKRTTSGIDGSNVDLCRPCFEASGLENEHSDYGHDTKEEGCPTCFPSTAPWDTSEAKVRLEKMYS